VHGWHDRLCSNGRGIALHWRQKQIISCEPCVELPRPRRAGVTPHRRFRLLLVHLHSFKPQPLLIRALSTLCSRWDASPEPCATDTGNIVANERPRSRVYLNPHVQVKSPFGDPNADPDAHSIRAHQVVASSISTLSALSLIE
jgi:hypothetical protein